MPVGTRVSTSLPRGYLYDSRLNGIKDSLAREAYFRAKLQADNLGRAPGDADTLRGLLFPLNPPSKSKMVSVIEAWVKHGLVLRYRVGGCWFIEIADNGSTMKLVGRMTDRSEFPSPPERAVGAFEKRFGFKPIRVSNPNVGTNPVHTESIPGLSSQKGVRREGKGTESEGSVRGETADSACSPSNRKAFDSDRDLFTTVTGGRFDPERGFKGYTHRGSFTLAVSKLAKLEEGVPATDEARKQFMGAVIDECEAKGFPVPPGWVRALSELRRELGIAK